MDYLNDFQEFVWILIIYYGLFKNFMDSIYDSLENIWILSIWFGDFNELLWYLRILLGFIGNIMYFSVLLLGLYRIRRRFKEHLRELWNLISYYGGFMEFYGLFEWFPRIRMDVYHFLWGI